MPGYRLKNIFLMRHGYSIANADNSVNKWMPDHKIPLTPTGEEQACEAGIKFADYLKSSNITNRSMRLWHSPYLRTCQTTDHLLTGMGESKNVFRDCREHTLLIEQRFGLFDGLSDEERISQFPKEQQLYEKYASNGGKFYAPMPYGESRYDVANRISQFFGTIHRDAKKANNGIENVFIVSHGTTIRAFVMKWLHKNVEWFENEPNPNNCSIRHIGRDNVGEWCDFGYIVKGWPGKQK